jgi:hypothetical protein
VIQLVDVAWAEEVVRVDDAVWVNVPEEAETIEDEGELAGGGLESRFIAKKSIGDSQEVVTS